VECIRLLLNRYHRRAESVRSALENVLGMQPYQVLPDDADIVADSLNQGVPLSELSRNGSVSRALRQLAEKIVNGVPAPQRGRARSEPRLPRLFSRAPAPKLKTM
ncbi:MAG TPA: pilus assembly protein, partial [Trinickia sp.]|nr:pilus assembly protein [Trinickia sp.]